MLSKLSKQWPTRHSLLGGRALRSTVLISPVRCAALRDDALLCLRHASSASSNRWKARQSGDAYAREARVAGLKSRAAFKLLQINDQHRIFRRGITVVDLGYAPGSWSQVAVNRCAPGGRVIGVDIIPAQPPRGVSTIQGDFLSPTIQAEVRNFVSDPSRGRPRPQRSFAQELESLRLDDESDGAVEEPGYIDMERHSASADGSLAEPRAQDEQVQHDAAARKEWTDLLTVDVVLSDMSAPWEPVTGYGKNSLINPYRRLMSTSGMPFRDHAGSMDLCTAALEFAYDTLREGGHFVCKFYQGNEDKLLEKRLRKLFTKVHREKPAASRSESREGYFVALQRRLGPEKGEVFAE